MAELPWKLQEIKTCWVAFDFAHSYSYNNEMENVSSKLLEHLPRPIAIIGLGISGLAALDLLLILKVPRSEIILFDQSSSAADFTDVAEMLRKSKPKSLLVSPGVPLAQRWISDFKLGGGRITSELELAFSCLKTEKCIAITGSIGKSTVTSLVGVAAAEADTNVFVGGNLGTPLAAYVKDVRLGRPRAKWLVLELSSYQLENFANLNCEFAIFTALTPNHLERYASLQEYYETKWTLAKKTSGALILNERGADLKNFVESQKLTLPYYWESRESELLIKHSIDKPQLIGDYNLDNLALAAKLAELAAWPISAFKALEIFPGLPHRLENLGSVNGVRFVNDSKATTMDSVIAAVGTLAPSCEPPHVIWLLIGGHDKGLPWERLQEFKNMPNLKTVFFGEFGSKAKLRTELDGPVFESLRHALKALPNSLRPGDTVLLSPGGTSHDEFKNFEERGSFFKSEILKVTKSG